MIPKCFICSSRELCNHREFEMLPYWRRRIAKIIAFRAEKYQAQRAERHPAVAIPRKPPASAQKPIVREGVLCAM